jgi:hypothetical protein
LLTHSKFEKVSFSNTQGRWEQNICPQLQTRDENSNRKCIIPGLETFEPGYQFFIDFGDKGKYSFCNLIGMSATKEQEVNEKGMYFG